MKLISLIVASSFVLSGCLATPPVLPKWPDPPGKDALVKCPNLQKLKDDPVLSEVSKTINNNYGEYYTCAVKADVWIEWYQIQKKIYEDITK